MSEWISPEEKRRRQRAERERQRAEREREDGPKPTKPKARSRFKGERWADVQFDPKKKNWLVQGLLPTQGFGVIYGSKKSYKSFATLDLGATIACTGRRHWAGCHVEHGRVFYIACEGQGGMDKRIAALKAAYPELDDDLPFHLIKARPNLGHQPGDSLELLASIRGELESDERPALIVVDTTARTLNGADENNEGLRNFADNCQAISDALGCFTFAVHHEGAGKTGRMRGSTTLDAASDVNWHVTKISNGAGLACRIDVEDSKDGESGFGFIATLRRHCFGDPEHDPECESTLIIDKIERAEIEAAAAPAKRQKITPTLGAFMTSVHQALDRFGIEVRLPDNGVKVKAVRIEPLLRETYYRKRADLEEDSKRKVFRDQLKAAIERELVVTGEINGVPMLWLPSRRAAAP
jgi:hypothetical protein